MARIERQWLRKIGAYGAVPGLRPLADESGDPEDIPQRMSTEGEMSHNPDEAQTPPQDETSLSIPPEVAERLKQEEAEDLRHHHNVLMAPQAFSLDGRYLRGLASDFARMVSKVAEDSADLPVPGDDEWDYVALTQRRFTGRNIHQCRQTREKRKVAVVLDSSPSCAHQANLFAAVATVAEALGDCDLYDAPNFTIHAVKSGWEWERIPNPEQGWDFKRRVVLAFGDFDGLDSICEASALRGNRIYWFSCEQRPETLEYGRERLLRDFKGHYMPANNLEQLMKAMRRVR